MLQVGGLVRGLVGPLVGNIGGASMWRCSQLKVRLQGNGSSADSLFLKHLLESATSADDKSTDIVHPRSYTVIECGESRSLSSRNRRAGPFWLALTLHQRSLCTISLPVWLTADNLAEIIAHEKETNELLSDYNRLTRAVLQDRQAIHGHGHR